MFLNSIGACLTIGINNIYIDSFKSIPQNLSLSLSNDYSLLSLTNVSIDVIKQKSIQETNTNGVGSIIPFLAPPEYKKKILERKNKAKKFKADVMEAGLSKDQKALLMNAVQGYFKEWMTGTQDSKIITELVKWIDKE